MHAQDRRTDGFLTRLKRDTRGNTLAIVGAALVPLAAMIGSGLDMSRAYMAKTRLQSACDAASLAARRVMTDDQMTDAVRAEAVRFFNFNFPQGLYGTDEFAPTVTRPQAGSVAITASTRIPTTIMSMFGFTSLPLNVSCEASLNFVNTDVMLVLDVTGSMSNSLNGTPRIVSLRDAVMALYDELDPVQERLAENGLRLRYGVVPYSSTVNVGALIREAGVSHLSESHDYQSRVARYETPVYVGTVQSPATSTIQTYSSDISASNCTRYGNNQSFSGSSGLPSAASNGASPPSDTIAYTYSPLDWGGSTNISGSGTKVCRRTRTETRTTYTTRYRFTAWRYQQASYDTSAFRTGASVTVASNTGGTVESAGAYTIQELPNVAENVATTPSVTALTTTTMNWNGCIEERSTVSTITASSNFNIPSAAYDLDINLVPHNEATRWRPMWPAIEYRRTGGSTSTTSGTSMASAACPAEARRLQTWTRAAMQSYVDGLLPTGNTYHDIGLVWGARLVSNAGIFADSPDTFNGMPVNRHIIFMTDGQLEPSTTTYSSYGVEVNDQRITNSSSGSGQYDRHLQRFRMICNATKGMNVSVWVIAFGTTLSADMRDCASNPSQASTSANRDELIARFRQIGNQIGALRLTQ